MGTAGPYRQRPRVACAVALAALAAIACAAPAKSQRELAAEALNRGIQAHNAGRIDEARAAYFQTLAHDASNKFAYYNLGQIARIGGKPMVAEGYYRSALEIDQDFVPPLFGLAAVRASLGATQEAIEIYSRTISLDPNHAAALYNLGLLLRLVERTAEGDEHIARALQLDPTLAPPAGGAGSPSPRPSPTGP